MIGQTISHYRILEKLGQGGMGEVYLAQDTTLDRKVALKFLSGKTAEDEAARKRFLREAKSAATINHPYICNVFEVGEAGNKTFLALEYVEGPTLSDRLQAGPLPLQDAVRKGAEIAEALEEAHRHEIVHRDLKPSNIMITPTGHIKVLDFGLAKQLSEESTDAGRASTAVTSEGAALGTLTYMSPEQLRGRQVDARSDIFSFGVVFYEMLAGVHPFRRAEAAETVSAILHEDPPPVARYRDGVPEILEHTLRKMLAKQREQRYQSIHEVLTNLSHLQSGLLGASRRTAEYVLRWGRLGLLLAAVVALLVLGWWTLWFQTPTLTPGEIRSIAILPLDNLRNDPEQEYFVDGMTEAMLTELSKLGSLRVISRRSVMKYKGSEKPLPEIARDLNVDALVEGSVLWVGDRVRISAQLITAAPERHLWAGTYDRSARDVLKLHSDVARAIAAAIKLKLAPEEEERLLTPREVDPAAYAAYLSGRHHLDRRTTESMRTSRIAFEQAIEKDPTFALAYAGLADYYNQVGMEPSVGNVGVERSNSFQKAEELAQRALALDDSLAEARLALTLARFNVASYEPGWLKDAEEGLLQAIQLNPNLAAAHAEHAMILSAWGRHENAFEAAARAQELDPVSLRTNFQVAVSLYLDRKYDRAITHFEKTLQLDPGYTPGRVALAKTLVQAGRFADAIEQCLRAGRSERYKHWLAYAYGMAGNESAARRILAEVSQRDVPGPLDMAVVHLGLGENEQALEWLEESTPLDLYVFIKTDPVFDPIRDQTRFQALLRRFNLVE